MTTLANPPIDTFQDILHALAQNPGLAAELRRHLHDADFLNLPQIVASLAETVEQLAVTVKEIAARQEKIEADIVDIKALLAQVIARQDKAEADITELKDGQRQLEAGQRQLEAGQRQLEAGQRRLETRQGRLEGRMGTITGTEYERRIARRARGILNRFLGFHNPQILQSIHHADSGSLAAAVSNAADTGAITPQAAYDLDSADIIAVGDNRDGIAVYAVIEVSETIANHDLTRARQRAATLTTAVQADTRPVVIGKEISADHRERAAQQDIAVIILNDDDEPL